jgi:hypothetical protein
LKDGLGERVSSFDVWRIEMFVFFVVCEVLN